MRYAMIMAGGSGKRLWPASRQLKPKQLIPLVNGKSLLTLAIERLEGIFPPERILIVTNESYAAEVRASCTLPAGNVVGEPEGRDTANAIALGAELIAARDAEATMAVFTADHIIRPQEEFARCVESACKAAEGDPAALVTFGIRPTWAHTGLGYVQCDKAGEGDGVHKVLGFKEKPDHHLALRYVESGDYFWNSGMFVWQVRTIREALRKHLPESARKLAPVGEAAAAGTGYGELLGRAYAELPRISIDYAVMEKAGHVLMVELTCEWLDVGSWPSLEQVLEQDDEGNVVCASRTALLDSGRNIVYAEDDHLVAVLGMDDCIIIHTPDATLVCNKSDSQRLKELVDWIGRRFGRQYV